VTAECDALTAVLAVVVRTVIYQFADLSDKKIGRSTFIPQTLRAPASLIMGRVDEVRLQALCLPQL